MNYFPNNIEEQNLIKFIAKYQYLRVSDAQYFFSSKKYYKKRISKLIEEQYLKKVGWELVLDKMGIKCAKVFNFDYTRLNRNATYLPRLLQISHIGAYLNNSTNVSFIPSIDIKPKEQFTIKSRKYIGLLNISGFEYLTYTIINKSDTNYISHMIYDIEKENEYKRFIILVPDTRRINIKDFSFGFDEVLLVDSEDENLEIIKYIHNINWSKVIDDNYKHALYLSNNNYCDYTDNKNKYVSTFCFIDTEKITRIKYFLRENPNKSMDIICPEELEYQIKKEIPKANFIPIKLNEYIEKEFRVYA